MDQLTPNPFAEISDNDAALRRQESRDSLLLTAQFRLVDGEDVIQVRIRNLSAGGLMAEYAGVADVGTAVRIGVRGVGWVSGRIAWVTAGRIGIAFDHLIDPKLARQPVGRAKRAAPPTIIAPPR
ncbi:PilZ domain-containing protein [uncultured Sphingomonas sp.]|uniref:PilZ domain-containing protein n=1 Tax=uncultured Sphingomonas sp. TaxID=158754 RepID=UPI0035CB246D